MSKILQIDDFKVGQFITVFKGKTIKEKIHTHIMSGEVTYVSPAHEDPSYKGAVLQVMAIDLPYMVLRIYSRIYSDGYSNNVFIAGLYQFKTLSNDYVRAVIGEKKFKENKK